MTNANNTHSKSALFLIELLIAVIIFAFCAAVCVWFFAEAYINSNEAKDLNNALTVAKNEAELFKAAKTYDDDFFGKIIFYDNNWQVCDSTKEEDAAYILTIHRALGGTAGLPVAQYILTVSSKLTDEEILSFPVSNHITAREGVS